MNKNEYNKYYYQKNKDILLANAKEYYSAHKEECKARTKKSRKKYYVENRDKILKRQKESLYNNKDRLARRREYESKYRETNKDMIKIKYEENKAKHNKFDRERKRTRREMASNIQMYYGCRNPGCSWTSEFHPSHLDFHHFNPDDKHERVSYMLNYSIEKLAKEINKCIVLCRNCHQLFHVGKVSLRKSMLCNVDKNLNVIPSDNKIDFQI